MTAVGSGEYAWDYRLRIEGAPDSPSVILFDARNQEIVGQFPGRSLDMEPVQATAESRGARWEISSESDLQEVGRNLGASIFSPALVDLLQDRVHSGPVRLGIETEDRFWAALPWEFAWLGDGMGGFLALCPNLHTYRCVKALAAKAEPKPLSNRILVVSANPDSRDYPKLVHFERELTSITRVLGSGPGGGLTIATLPYATPASFRRALSEHLPDVVHFIGHGDIRPTGGCLVFEDGRPNQASLMFVEELSAVLNAAGAQLLVLSSCLTGGPAAGIGRSLIADGLSAVVAMQTPIKDSAAHLFARTLYGSLAEGASLEIAVDDGRSAISGFAEDWGAPVIYASSALTGDSIRLDVARRSPSTPNHNIPEEDRPFVGRATEREALSKLLRRGSTRLVTVSGMGGMGKTRLAKQVAIDLHSEFPDGARLIECEALQSREELLTALGAVQGLPSGPVSVDQILESLSSQQRLLLFDCFERIADYAEVLSTLLRAAPGIKILVTSRVVLALPAEKEFPLDPMSSKRRKAKVAEGIELFCESAAFADPKFELTRKNQQLIAVLLDHLEGVPLAIVLAAGRLRHMTLEELTERVQSQRLDVLKRRPVSKEDRHSDLLRVVGDSLELLFESDRRLIKQLSVFQGGFFQDDALAVLGRGTAIEDGIAVLRDHSLLMAQTASSRMRFRLLDTIREYLDRLPDDMDVTEMRYRHATHFAKLAQRIRSLYDAGQYVAARESLALDLGNFRASVHYAVAARNDGLVRQLAKTLARVYFEAGSHDEFEALASAAESLETGEDVRLLIELHGLHGELCRRNNRIEDTIKHWLARAELCERVDDVENEVDSRLDIADFALKQQRSELATQMLVRFEQLRSRLTNGALLASGIVVTAKVQFAKGDVSSALKSCAQAEQIMSTVKLDRNSLFVYFLLTQVYRGAGAESECLRLFYRLLYDSILTGHFQSACRALLGLSETLEQMGQIRQSVQFLVIATAIPPTVTVALRDQITKRRQQFSKEPYKGDWDLGVSVLGKQAWDKFAIDLVPAEFKTPHGA